AQGRFQGVVTPVRRAASHLSYTRTTMKAFLAARSIFFVVLLPGTVAGYGAFPASSFHRPAPLARVISFRLLGGADHPHRCSGSARFRLGVLCRRTRHAGTHRSAAATGREWALPFHQKPDVQWGCRRSLRAGLVLLKRSASRVRGDGASLLPPFRCTIRGAVSRVVIRRVLLGVS